MMTDGPLIIKPTDRDLRAVGKVKTALDLSRLHFDQSLYGIRVMGAWLRIDPAGPCLVLAAPGADLRRITPCIVPLQTAWVWDETHGDAMHAELMASGFVLEMGGNPFDKRARHAVIAAIRERLGDLVAMPPEPAPDRVLAGDLIQRTEHGETVRHEVWTDA